MCKYSNNIMTHDITYSDDDDSDSTFPEVFCSRYCHTRVHVGTSICEDDYVMWNAFTLATVVTKHLSLENATECGLQNVD